ncbi:MAG: hypothetical protein OXB95_05220 [Rhodobacteraceae bacterium]|nr:hypothetical protein [Paracoccaceae bacterium]
MRTKQLKDDTQLRDSDVCLSDVLLRWYDCNARTLPWRMHDNSHVLSESDRVYRIWLAEVMLQQTQVGTVIPFYEEFLRRWPTVEDLADESGEALMSAWAVTVASAATTSPTTPRLTSMSVRPGSV